MTKFKYAYQIGTVVICLIALGVKSQPLLAQSNFQEQLSQRNFPKLPQRPVIPSPLPPQKEPLLNSPSIQPHSPVIPRQNQYPSQVKVKEFAFEGNTVFSDRQLSAVVAAYKGKNLTFADLLTVRAAINRLYIKQGYITSGAFISFKRNQSIRPTPEGVVVTVQIVEGKLEQINLSGSSSLRKYVRSRLKAATSPVLNYNQLIEALRLLQVDPLIKLISAQLDVGSRKNTSILNVEVQAQQPFKLETALDNFRSPAIGSFQRQVQLGHANLLGLGDSLNVGYRNTDGSDAVEASYLLPVNPQNGSIQLDFVSVSGDIIERPFNRLDILSDARAYDLTFRQPIIRQATANATKEFALGLTASRTESTSSLLNTPFPLSAGADEKGRTRLSALRFFQEWTGRSSKEVLFARSQFSLGIGVFDATINSNAPDSRFFAWRGQAFWLRRVRKDTNLVLRTDMQLATRPLVPIEQFGLGGGLSVRGYRQDALLTDNGLLASAELQIPVISNQSQKLHIIPFFDVGTTWNNNGDTNNNDPNVNSNNLRESGTLASVGLGLQYQLDDRFNARIDWGIPLISFDTNSSSNTWQEDGIYFSVRYRPF